MDITQEKKVVIYGAGQCYRDLKEKIIRYEGKIDYICDQKFEYTSENIFDNVQIIRREQLMSLGGAVVYVCLYGMHDLIDVSAMLSRNAMLFLKFPGTVHPNIIGGRNYTTI